MLSFLLICIKHLFQHTKFWAVIRGQWRSFDMQHAYFLVIIIQTIFRSKKVIRGQIMVMRGLGQEQKRKVVIYDILRCSAFFWYTSCICSKSLSLEVIRGQWRSMKVSLRTVICPQTCLDIFFVMLLSLAFIWYATF